MTIQELSSVHEVHQNMVAQWKKQLVDGAEQVCEKDGKDRGAKAAEKKLNDVYRQIGQLQVENYFLKRSTNNYTGRSRRCRAEPPDAFDQ